MTTVEVLRHTPAVLAVLSGLLGLMVGSFLNVVIHRLPRIMERQWRAECAELSGSPAAPEEPFNLVVPRSACPHCGHRLAPLENIPVASYIALRGRCSACRGPISLRYPVVELLAGALAALVAWHFRDDGVQLLGALLFTWALIALAFIDLDTFYLPDDITLPLLWTGLLFSLGGAFADLRSAVIGAAAGYVFLWAVYWAFRLVTGKEGMGYGDFKLLAAIGAWLGWQALPVVVLLSSLVGALVGLGMMIFARRGRNAPIPFGPYLAAAGLVALLWGDALIRAYLMRL